MKKRRVFDEAFKQIAIELANAKGSYLFHLTRP